MKVLKFGGTSVGSPEAVHALVTHCKRLLAMRVFVVTAIFGHYRFPAASRAVCE
jgi:aspartokinase